jgi:hypothetical protein
LRSRQNGLLALQAWALPTSQVLLRKNGHSYDQIVLPGPAIDDERDGFFHADIPVQHRR